jgi:hypothetical protein
MIHFADTNKRGRLIPPRLSYFPDMNSAFFEQQAYTNWQQNGNSVYGYQDHKEVYGTFNILKCCIYNVQLRDWAGQNGE